MTRRTVTVEAQYGRDKERGKKFLLTEMSAVRAEKWATRALIALINSGIQLTDDEASAGMAGIAQVAARGAFKFTGGGMSFAEFEPLLDEMLECVQIKEPAATRTLTEDDIEEVPTLFLLRSEVLKLHTGFSLAERLSGYLGGLKSPA